jgi:protein-disulfide isomerase
MTDQPTRPSKSAKARLRAEKAAAAAAEARRRERRRNLLVGAGVVLAMALVVGVIVLISVSRDDSDEVADRATEGSSDYGLVVGPEDAPHTIVIYEDFLCPICGIVENTAGERLSRLAEQGQVRIDYRPVAFLSRFGPYSEDALNAFFVVREESGDDVAKTFHDLLFANQPAETGPFPDTGDLLDLAVQAGAEKADVQDGIENGGQADLVAGATQAADAIGVTGTPTIVLDGEPFADGGDWQEIANNLVAAVE